ncbi:MAG TPA: nucleotide pyrophosphatase/phosphodiesterase family protein [Chloroflexota bacterium]|nr:nucleotide pyrophosphatase/phosphodiesterase family protein [Chloroflexota bacterium]
MNPRRLVLVVWDGLRPDLLSEAQTPTACRLRDRGVWFERSTCVYPSETRVNSATLATGAYPAVHGIVGNTLYLPQVDAVLTLNTGDHNALAAIERLSGPLIGATPFARSILDAGGSVAMISSGSPGSAFLVHPLAGGPGTLLINRDFILPEAQAEMLARRFGPVPPGGTPAIAQNAWVTRVTTEYVFPEVQPTVTICWYRDPDTTQHALGLGTAESLASLHANDQQLAILLEAIDRLGWTDTTDVLLTSDHGFSTIARTAGTSGPGISGGLVEAGLKQRPESTDVVVAGSALYLTGEACERAQEIVAWLMAQPWIGNIFVRDGGPASDVPGTLPLSTLWDGRVSARCPDIQCAYQWTDATNEFGIPGTTLRGGNVASHGTVSPYDMRNTLIAAGPDFRRGHTSTIPAGIVDVAPTLLALLGLPPLATAQGRVLNEALHQDTEAGGIPAVSEDEVSAEAPLSHATGRYRQRIRRARVASTTYILDGGADRLS